MSEPASVFTLIAAGDAAGVQALLAANPALAAAPNDQGITPVLWALYHGKRDLATLLAAAHPLGLLEAAAMGDAARVQEALGERPDGVNTRSGDGFTALHYTAFFGAPAAVAELLLQAGADPNAVAGNPTLLQPLHSAAAARNLEVARLLVAAGAAVNARQQRGFTPLMAAAQNGDSALADLLTAAGADLARASDDGKTAADYARDGGHADLAGRLSG